MRIAFRNIFFNDFSTMKSSYRFNLTHSIFRETTIINTKLTLGVRLWLRWKLTLFYYAHGCGQFRESAPNVIYDLWGLIINGGLSLHELLQSVLKTLLWRGIIGSKIWRTMCRRCNHIIIPPTKIWVIPPPWIVCLWIEGGVWFFHHVHSICLIMQHLFKSWNCRAFIGRVFHGLTNSTNFINFRHNIDSIDLS